MLVLVILWLLVLVGPAAIMKANLSSGATTMLDAYYGATAAIAVAVTIDYYQIRTRNPQARMPPKPRATTTGRTRT